MVVVALRMEVVVSAVLPVIVFFPLNFEPVYISVARLR